MFARIYQPSRNAMQSGQARPKDWVLEFVPEAEKVLDPLMGWTGTADPTRQVRLGFDTRDAAIAYAEQNGIAFRVFEPTDRRHILRTNGYGDNFAFQRRQAWTH